MLLGDAVKELFSQVEYITLEKFMPAGANQSLIRRAVSDRPLKVHQA